MVTAQDAQNALKNLFADTLQELLETEMDEHLGYEKHDVGNKKTTNSRNGKSKKRISSVYGQQEIAVPRDRQGEFEPVAVKKHQTNVTGIEDQIIALYAKGVSTREIQDHLQNVYGLDMSPGFISNVTVVAESAATERLCRRFPGCDPLQGQAGRSHCQQGSLLGHRDRPRQQQGCAWHVDWGERVRQVLAERLE